MHVMVEGPDRRGDPVRDRRGGGVAGIAAHRPGFTMVELVFALIIMAFLAGLAMPKLSHALSRSRVDSAAAVLASDLELALSLSVRQGTPVRIDYDAMERTYRFTDRASGKVLHSRRFGADCELGVSNISFSESSVDVFPRRGIDAAARHDFGRRGEGQGRPDARRLIRVAVP